VADDRTDPLEPFVQLLAEHSRLLEEKARMLESRRTPPTTYNFELTKVIKRIVERARTHREAVGEQSRDVRSLLREKAEQGSWGAEDALDLLGDEDPWWRER